MVYVGSNTKKFYSAIIVFCAQWIMFLWGGLKHVKTETWTIYEMKYIIFVCFASLLYFKLIFLDVSERPFQ